MSPLAIGILGYVMGLVTALMIVASLLLVRGGSDLRAHDQRERGHKR